MVSKVLDIVLENSLLIIQIVVHFVTGLVDGLGEDAGELEEAGINLGSFLVKGIFEVGDIGIDSFFIWSERIDMGVSMKLSESVVLSSSVFEESGVVLSDFRVDLMRSHDDEEL